MAVAIPGRRGPPRAVRTPTVLQMEITECGAAALTAVLGYFGRTLLLQEVREACAVSRDGVNARQMVETARSYGLEAEGRRATADDLRRLEPPFIVFWEQNHFLVVEGFGRRRVRLNDPASGRRTTTYEEFAARYSGIALVFRPGPEFAPDRKGRHRRPLLELARAQSRSFTGIAYALIAGLAAVVPRAAGAMLTGIFVADVLGAGNVSWGWRVAAAAAILAVLQLLLVLFQQRVLLRLQMKLSITLTAEFLWHLMRLDIRFFEGRSAGGLVSRIQLNANVAQLLSGQLASAAISFATMFAFGVIMLVLNVELALVAFGVALLNALALGAVSRARTAVNQNLQQKLVRLSGTTYLGISMIDDMKATGAEDEFFSRWAGLQAQTVNASQRLGRLTYGLLVVPGFLALVNLAVILAVGGLLVLDGRLSLAGLVTFQLLAGYFIGPISQIVGVASQFQNSRAWIQQIDDVFAQPAQVSWPATSDVPTPDPAEHRRLDGHLELRNVTFGYVPNQPPLVRDLSVIIAPGERVAVVGRTGSGKSTVANLVTGLLEPWSGEILLDGKPRADISQDVMTASLAKVDQSVLLFSSSIADNIRFWDDTVPADRVIRAAEDACIDDEIDAKPKGFAYPVAEGGRNLSGGQRQRLEIARALATNPSILILDEATSALDTVTEEQIDTRLRRRGCTCLLIAHRLSTIRDCDQILVLDHGEVVQRGTHEELLAVEGEYRELVSSG